MEILCSYHNDSPFQQYIPHGIMVGALFCPIWQIFPVWFHCTMFQRLCCCRFTAELENYHSDTLHNISRHELFKIACMKSVLWPASIGNVVTVSLSGGSLGYWTACNNFKRYCTLPYCVPGTKATCSCKKSITAALWSVVNSCQKMASLLPQAQGKYRGWSAQET